MTDLLDAVDLSIGPAAVVETAETPVVEPVAPVTLTPRTRAVRSDKGLSRGPRSGGRGLLYFDLETIPDHSRFDQFGLDPIPEIEPLPELIEFVQNERASLADCKNSAEKFLDATVESIKLNIWKLNPCDDYLVQLDKAERATAKPRKGVLDVIGDVMTQDDTRLSEINKENTNRMSEMEKNNAKRLLMIEQQRKEMAVSPEMNRIVAMGWAVGNDDVRSLVVGEKNAGDGETTEIDILETLWSLAAQASTVIGFNILGFDLPTIYVRSMLLDVRPSRQFDLKPWGNDCIDLMAVRFPKSSAKRLKWLAAAMDIEVPAGDVDGSRVEELWKTDPAKVGEYVRSDVSVTRELHQMYRGFFCA